MESAQFDRLARLLGRRTSRRRLTAGFVARTLSGVVIGASVGERALSAFSQGLPTKLDPVEGTCEDVLNRIETCGVRNGAGECMNHICRETYPIDKYPNVSCQTMGVTFPNFTVKTKASGIKSGKGRRGGICWYKTVTWTIRAKPESYILDWVQKGTVTPQSQAEEDRWEDQIDLHEGLHQEQAHEIAADLQLQYSRDSSTNRFESCEKSKARAEKDLAIKIGNNRTRAEGYLQERWKNAGAQFHSTPRPQDELNCQNCGAAPRQLTGSNKRNRQINADSCEPEPCPQGQQSCGGQCVDTNSDNGNCGGCAGGGGSTCSGGSTCQGGACACPAGQTTCGGACVDTASDPANCGSCGRKCGAFPECYTCEGSQCRRPPDCMGICCGGRPCTSVYADGTCIGTDGGGCSCCSPKLEGDGPNAKC